MATSDPLLDALCVEDMLLVTVQRGHEVITTEVTPADRTLPHETILALIKTRILFLLLSLLSLKCCLV